MGKQYNKLQKRIRKKRYRERLKARRKTNRIKSVA